jgi:hypothetical protein
MKEIIEFAGEDGEIIYVEITKEGHSQGRTRSISDEDSLVTKASKTFGGAVGVIKTVGRQLHGAIAHLQPQKVAVEFSFKMDAKAGVLLTSIGTEANFKVTLEWTNPPVPPVA